MSIFFLRHPSIKNHRWIQAERIGSEAFFYYDDEGELIAPTDFGISDCTLYAPTELERPNTFVRIDIGEIGAPYYAMLLGHQLINGQPKSRFMKLSNGVTQTFYLDSHRGRAFTPVSDREAIENTAHPVNFRTENIESFRITLQSRLDNTELSLMNYEGAISLRRILHDMDVVRQRDLDPVRTEPAETFGDALQAARIAMETSQEQPAPAPRSSGETPEPFNQAASARLREGGAASFYTWTNMEISRNARQR